MTQKYKVIPKTSNALDMDIVRFRVTQFFVLLSLKKTDNHNNSASALAHQFALEKEKNISKTPENTSDVNSVAKNNTEGVSNRPTPKMVTPTTTVTSTLPNAAITPKIIAIKKTAQYCTVSFTDSLNLNGDIFMVLTYSNMIELNSSADR